MKIWQNTYIAGSQLSTYSKHGGTQQSCHLWQEDCSSAELASQHPLAHLFSTGTQSKLPKYSTATLEEITSLHSRKMPAWQCGAMCQHQNRLKKQLITIKRSSLKKSKLSLKSFTLELPQQHLFGTARRPAGWRTPYLHRGHSMNSMLAEQQQLPCSVFVYRGCFQAQYWV